MFILRFVFLIAALCADFGTIIAGGFMKLNSTVLYLRETSCRGDASSKQGSFSQAQRVRSGSPHPIMVLESLTLTRMQISSSTSTNASITIFSK